MLTLLPLEVLSIWLNAEEGRIENASRYILKSVKNEQAHEGKGGPGKGGPGKGGPPPGKGGPPFPGPRGRSRSPRPGQSKRCTVSKSALYARSGVKKCLTHSVVSKSLSYIL